MIRLSDLCVGGCVCNSANPPWDCDHDCATCSDAECSCGLPWDPDRGAHTLSGIVLSPEVLSRILAREGEALEQQERIDAERSRRVADELRRMTSWMGGSKP